MKNFIRRQLLGREEKAKAYLNAFKQKKVENKEITSQRKEIIKDKYSTATSDNFDTKGLNIEDIKNVQIKWV